MREHEKFYCLICGRSFESVTKELEHEFLCVKALKLKQALQEKEQEDAI